MLSPAAGALGWKPEDSAPPLAILEDANRLCDAMSRGLTGSARMMLIIYGHASLRLWMSKQDPCMDRNGRCVQADNLESRGNRLTLWPPPKRFGTVLNGKGATFRRSTPRSMTSENRETIGDR
jgi:hypothetical protein